MKKNLTFIALLLGLTLSLGSCGSADEAQKTSDKFFQLVLKHKYNEADDLLVIGSASKCQIDEALKQIANHPTFGKLKSAQKAMGFNTQVVNGVTSVTLNYNLTYENSEESMEVLIVDRGDGYKIEAVQ